MSLNPSIAKDLSIAVIGCGNMGAALVRGFCSRLGIPGANLYLCDHGGEKAEALAAEFSAKVSSLDEAVANASVLILAVKPKHALGVLRSARAGLAQKTKSFVLISVAAGVRIEDLQQAAGGEISIVRVMPNLPTMIGEGLSAVFGEQPGNVKIVETLFRGVGEVVVLGQESELDVATALGAGAPAFIFQAIEALADGGVKMGLTRQSALRMAAQVTRGAASMVLEGVHHPATLKDMVASPGGTTIAGLHVLEKAGVRGAFISAVEASTNRAIELRAVERNPAGSQVDIKSQDISKPEKKA